VWSMAMSSVGAHLVGIPFAIVGLTMLVWNRRLAAATIAGMKAFDEELGLRSLERLHAAVFRPALTRGLLVCVGSFYAVLGILAVVRG
jgi:hypothetical protein